MSIDEPRLELCGRVLGQDPARVSVARAMASGRLAHAYLLTGPEGVGKRLFAEGIARALLCAQSTQGKGDPADVGPCGACRACAIPLESHPGYRVLEAPAGGAIDIATVRDAITALALRSGDRRAVLIDGADSMADPAANALLKTLEEPPPGIVFLLITARPAHLLATIHSRTQRIPFTALDALSFEKVIEPFTAEVDLSAWSDGDGDVASVLHRIAGGSPGVATRLLAGIEACGGLLRFRELLRGVGAERPASLIDYLPALPKETVRARMHRLLELVQYGSWGERSADPDARRETGERALLVAELIRGLGGGRSTEITLEILARVLRGASAEEVARSLPRSFFATG